MMTKFVVAMVFAMMLVSIVSAQMAVPPSFTTQPASTTVKDHSPVILTVAVAGTAPITIQWQENSGKDSLWADIPGANQLTLDISSRYVDRLNNQGFNYRAVATNVAGQAISSSASITITLPPEILSQNVTINGLNNGFVSMSATANGSPLPTVTWSVSGDRGVTYTAVPASSTITNVALSTGYPASTQSTLTLRVLNTNTGFFYRATFTNAAGSATTNDITLLVPLYSPPAFFVHPLSQTIVLGTDVTFSVDYSGADLPTIQWQIQQTQFPYWLDIPGATGNSYTRVAVTDADRGALFRAVATNRLGVAFSNAAVLTIPASTPPAIITQPTFTGRTTWGTVVSLLTRASGSPVPTAQWQRTFGSNMVYSNIGTAGATLPTLSFIAQPNDTLSSFRVVYTNSAGSVTSNSFTLTLANPAAPLIEQQPVNLSVQQGETATFFALVSGAPTPNVQWQVSSDLGYTYTNITGATTTTLNIVAAGPPNYKLYYRLLANNTSGFVFSAPAVLTVVRVDAPIFTIQPTTQEVAVGRSVVFESATIARPPATYQWQSSQDGILFNNVAGATFPTLSFPAVAATQQSTYYRVVATNSAGVTTSNAALLTVYSLNAPVVTVQPKSKNVLSGSTVSLVSLATGTPTPSVQWLSRSGAGQNFTAIPGATQITYTFTATGFQQYRAVFTNTDGTALSAIATVQTYGRLYRVSQSAASILSIGSSSLLLFTIIVLISIAF